MSNIGKTAVRRVGGTDIVCREMTVAQARAMLERAGSGRLLDDLLFEELRLVDLQEMTGLTSEQIGDMLPSDLRELVAGCKEANPDFFALMARLSKAG